MIHVVVCGGRHYKNRAHVFRTLDELHAKHCFTKLIEGGADGADALARQWVKKHPDIAHTKVSADWTDLSHPDAVIRVRKNGTKYDAKAGPRRNAKMLGLIPDMLIAFPGEDGTADMVKQARKAGGIKIVEVPEPTGELR